MLKTLFVLSHLLVISTLATAQSTGYPYVDMKIGWRAMHTDLTAFNASMPANTAQITGPMNAVELSMDVHSKKFMVNSDLSIGTRKRNFLNDYEQIMLSQTSWSLTAGPRFEVGKNKRLSFSTLGGFAFSSLDLRYRNDSVNKPSSISWIFNQQPFQQDEDPRHYTNPGFMLVVQQRASIVVMKYFSISAFIGYQQDLGKGRWHYEYGFIRRNSPETFGTGLNYGATLGLRLPLEPTVELGGEH